MLSPASEENVFRVLRDDGTLDPQRDPHLSPADVLEIYRAMATNRVLDERLLTLQRQGRIGFHVGSLGEEASIIAAAWALAKSDWIFPCYREAGAALLRGLSLQRFVDNVFGNANDTVRGRQMPDHHTYRAGLYASTSSPVGTQIPHAVGVGWAAKLRKEDAVALAFFGDGATSTNDFHAGMNFAAVFRVPVIFLCRNNGWAISTPLERQTRTKTFAEKGAAYGVPAVRVDGNDIFAMVSVVRDARARAAAGEGPTLIEALTYRMGAHTSSDDPNRYRSEDEVKPWTERDPLERARRWLIKNGHYTLAEDDQLRRDVDGRFKQAVAAAEATAPPSLSTLFEDVYQDLPRHLREQRDELVQTPRAPAHGS
jgi:2-oxoisovalerate dehydrogenase E1 component alpha subunit